MFSEGARLGDPWSQLHLGQMYQRGRHAQATLDSASTPADKNPFEIVKRIPGPNQDYPMALKWYTRSAEQRNRVAAYKLGKMYETGEGTAQDYGTAFKYLRQAASQQYSPALLEIGKFYELGLGTAVNAVGAYVAYGLASEQHNAAAHESMQLLIHKMTTEQLRQAHASLKTIKLAFEGDAEENSSF